MWTWLEYLLGWRQRPRYTTSPGAPNQPGRIPVIELRDGDSLWQGHADYLRRLGDRYYEFHDGRKDRTKPAPVVMLLHGRGGNAASARWNFQFEAEADKRGWVVVYPAGQKQVGKIGGWEFNLAWNDGVGKDDPPLDDVNFLTDVLWDFNKRWMRFTKLCIGGHSNGSAMAFRYAMTSSGFKAHCIAGNAGAIAPEAGSPRVPIFYSHATGDKLVDYKQCMEIIFKWIEHNGAERYTSNFETVWNCIEYRYDDKHSSPPCPVVRWSVSPGAHSVPGGEIGPWEKSWGEPVNRDVSFAEEVGKFFDRFIAKEQP